MPRTSLAHAVKCPPAAGERRRKGAWGEVWFPPVCHAFFEKGEYDGKGLPFPLLQPREERGPPQRWTEEEEEEVFFSVDLY